MRGTAPQTAKEIDMMNQHSTEAKSILEDGSSVHDVCLLTMVVDKRLQQTPQDLMVEYLHVERTARPIHGV